MRIHFILVLALFSVGCVTHIKPSAVQNPPPSEKFSAFGRFELQRVSLSSSYSDDSANQRAAVKIQEYFNERVSPIIDGWNRAAPQGQQARVMAIEPRIEHLKFIGGATRFWVGPIAGSSAVIMKIRYVDKASGKLLAEPEFFQRAAAWSGAFTVGGQDNAMLARIVSLVADYTNRNYREAVGGPSGATDDLVNAPDWILGPTINIPNDVSKIEALTAVQEDQVFTFAVLIQSGARSIAQRNEIFWAVP